MTADILGNQRYRLITDGKQHYIIPVGKDAAFLAWVAAVEEWYDFLFEDANRPVYLTSQGRPEQPDWAVRVDPCGFTFTEWSTDRC